MGVSLGIPQFDPECQTHLFLRFSPCRFHPHRFPVKMDSFLRAAMRARLGKISCGQSSPWPFQPNIGMSPGLPSLTQNVKPTSSYFFHHAHSAQVDSWSKWKIFCAPRHVRAWTTSVLSCPWPFQPNMGMSPGVPQFDPEFQTHLFLRFSPCPFHPHRFFVKMQNFLSARPWAKSVLATPRQGHYSQIWVCHRGHPHLMQNAKPTSSCLFHHADSTHIDSRSKWKFFCALQCARA